MRTVIVTGIAGNNCVLFGANDAYMRDLKLVVPADCIAVELTCARLAADHLSAAFSVH